MQKLYFLRHNIHISYKNIHGENETDHLNTKNLLDEIWKSNYAIIDYEEITAIDKAFLAESYKYPNDGATVAKFGNFAKEGGYIAIVSNRSHKGEMKLGKIYPNSTPELVSFNARPNYKFKAIKLAANEGRTIVFSEAPGLFSKIPRQKAFSHWPSALKQFELVFNNQPFDLDITHFHHQQLEVLCYEYLRHRKLIESLTLPIGRSLIFVDIVGRNKTNQKVLAQVTFDGINKKKIDALKLASGADSNSQLYYFCKDPYPIDTHVQVIGILDVLKYFEQHNKALLGYLLQMAG